MLPAVVVERQTRHFEGVVRVTSYGFKSHQPHHNIRLQKKFLTKFRIRCILYKRSEICQKHAVVAERQTR